MSDRGTGDLVVTIVFAIFGILAVAARVYTARKLARRLRHHDYFIFFGLALGIAQLIITYIAVLNYGIGEHQKQLAPSQVVSGRKLLLTNEILWLWAVTSIRLSLLLFYLDLLRSKTWIRNVDLGCIATTVAFLIAFMIDIGLRCRPFSLYWTSHDGRQCHGIKASELSSACISLVLDFTITLIPMPALWRIQMPLKKRIAVNALFGFGFLVLAVNIVRIVFLANANLHDYSFAFAPQALLVSLETQIGIIVACLPTLSPLVLPRSGGTSKDEIFATTHSSLPPISRHRHKQRTFQRPMQQQYTKALPSTHDNTVSTWNASLADMSSPFGKPLPCNNWPEPPEAAAQQRQRSSSSKMPSRPPILRRLTSFATIGDNIYKLHETNTVPEMGSNMKLLYDDVSLYGPKGGESSVAAFAVKPPPTPTMNGGSSQTNTSSRSNLGSRSCGFSGSGNKIWKIPTAKGSRDTINNTSRTNLTRISGDITESEESVLEEDNLKREKEKDNKPSNDSVDEFCITVQRDIEIYETRRDDCSFV